MGSSWFFAAWRRVSAPFAFHLRQEAEAASGGLPKKAKGVVDEEPLALELVFECTVVIDSRHRLLDSCPVVIDY